MQSKADFEFDSDLGVYGVPGNVSPWRVEFDVADRAFCDRLDSGGYRIRVLTEPGLTEALVVVGDHAETATGFRLDLVGAAESTALWESIVDVAPGAKISFAFRNPDGEPVYVVAGGIAVAVERLDRWQLPDIAPLGIPAWAQGAVIYQIFPDRFADGDASNNPPGSEPWGSEPTPVGFQGGDLQGIEQHLDYLEALGVDVIYLNPIAVSPSNHRYDTVDHRHVEASLGGDDAMVSLVDRAHARGIRMMADLSINHVHPSFPPFADVVANGARSEYAGWFDVASYPPRLLVNRQRLDVEGVEWLDRWQEDLGLAVEDSDHAGSAVKPTYDSWFGVPSMPRVDLANPAARTYMLDILSSWVDRFDIDAWRMDVARYIDPDVWPEARRRLIDSRADFFLVAEIMGDAHDWLQGDGFHAAMNYTFRAIVLDLLTAPTPDAGGFVESYLRLLGQYAWDVTLANHNLIGSHDTPRFLTEAGGEVWRLELATVLQMTLPGSPGIYYGDEVALEGGKDPGCRGAFPWDPPPLDHAIARSVADLTELRRKHPALVRGNWRNVPVGPGTIAYRRSLDEESVLVVVNPSSEIARVGADSLTLLWGPTKIVADTLVVPPRSAAIATGT